MLLQLVLDYLNKHLEEPLYAHAIGHGIYIETDEPVDSVDKSLDKSLLAIILAAQPFTIALPHDAEQYAFDLSKPDVDLEEILASLVRYPRSMGLSHLRNHKLRRPKMDYYAVMKKAPRTIEVEHSDAYVDHEHPFEEVVGVLRIPDSGPWDPSLALTQVANELGIDRSLLRLDGVPAIDYQFAYGCPICNRVGPNLYEDEYLCKLNGGPCGGD